MWKKVRRFYLLHRYAHVLLERFDKLSQIDAKCNFLEDRNRIDRAIELVDFLKLNVQGDE